MSQPQSPPPLPPPQHSAMSITQLVNDSSSEEMMDPDVKIAVEALGDMSRSKVHMTLPPLSTPSTTTSSPLPTPTSSSVQRLSFSSGHLEEINTPQSSNRFIYRVSNIPLVNSALRAYENSKNSIPVVKYGAEMVESLAAPIYDKFGKPALSNVDEWGCKQLDKLEEKYPSYVSKYKEEEDELYEEYEDDDAQSATSALARASLMDDHEGLRKRRDSRDDFTANRSKASSRSTSPHKPYSKVSRHRPIAPRSRWHQIVMHASSAAGTTAAVISEESMKCLKYCLSWLQYATQHIEQQMNLLRRYLVSLNTSGSQSLVAQQESPLPKIKKEIVDTLRKVVEVISRYAGSGLPEQAKAAVRSFILALPSRWAVLHSKSTSPTASPALQPVHSIHETSMNVLNFGGESIEMIQSVAHVFSDTVERAELWLSRLSVVSSHKKNQERSLPVEPMDLN
ncbi:transcription factor Opi1-domain-containing protein [Sporodiniella umbellata]|nr:transcription factor Opi1-domain-containing protein [Sporodiniella umbellata]